jgi:hypothetical protein
MSGCIQAIDMRFGMWNDRSLYRAGSLVTDLMGVQEVRWEGSGTEPAGEYIFLYRKRNENHEFGTVFLCRRESYQQVSGLILLVIGCHT